MTPRDRVMSYVDRVLSGAVISNRWVQAAAKRFLADLNRPDVRMDWDEVDAAAAFVGRCGLVEEWSGRDFDLDDWQLWLIALLFGWKWSADGCRRTKFAVVQVGRGAGKTTLMAALALYDLTRGPGRRVHVIANKRDQAAKALDTAKVMAPRVSETLAVQFWRIIDKEADSVFTALTSSEKSLDGLSPSFWIGDEAAEWKGRFITKLTTTAAKRRESLGVLISTPGNNPDQVYGEEVELGRKVLLGDVRMDANQYLLWGIDDEDDEADEACWAKANPGMPRQPRIEDLRTAWQRMQVSALSRREFARFHCCRAMQGRGTWLDMGFWQPEPPVTLDEIRGRPAWLGVDLSKTFDLSAVVAAVPLEDGRVALYPRFYWPSDWAAEREIYYSVPVRRWAADGLVTLTPGRVVDLQAIRRDIRELASQLSVRCIGYDRYGSVEFRRQLVEEDSLPLLEAPQDIRWMGAGSQVWQDLWVGRRLRHGDHAVLRRCCADAEAWRDNNGNIRPIKKGKSLIDGLVASIIAVHCWRIQSTTRPSMYESEQFVI